MNHHFKLGGLFLWDSMNWISFNPRNNRLHDVSPCNIHGGIVIGKSRIAAGLAYELTLRASVRFLAVSTFRALTGSVAGVNSRQRHAIPNATVFDKASKLVKRPSHVFCPVFTLDSCALSNARQILELNAALTAFSVFNYRFRNYMVCIASKTGFTARYLLKSALSRPTSTFLQARAMPRIILSFGFNNSATKNFTIGGCSNVGDPQVNTQCATRWWFGCFVCDANLNMCIPLPAFAFNQLASLNTRGTRKKMALILTYRNGQFYALINSAKTNDLFVRPTLQSPAIVANRSSLKAARLFAFALSYAFNSCNSKIRREPKRSQVSVNECVKAKPVELIMFTRNLQCVITGGCEQLNSSLKAFNLTDSGLKLASDGQDAVHVVNYSMKPPPSFSEQFRCQLGLGLNSRFR